MKYLLHSLLLAASLLAGTVCLAAQAADLVILNADVRTMAREKPQAEAIAIRGNKFVAVGKNEYIRQFVGPETRQIDVAGRLVLPGFNDAHVHFAAIGNKFSTMDVRADLTAETVAEKIAQYVRVLPKGRWILGSGFSDAFVAAEGGRLLALIDPLTPVNPVFIYSADGKAAFANNAAIKLAKARQIPARSESVAAGLLSGQIVRVVASAIPADHMREWPEILETASNYAASLGVTSVQDMHSDELADVYRGLDRAGKLKTRVYDCSPLSSRAKLAADGIEAADGGAMVRSGCVKYFSEGDESEVPFLRREIAAADKAGLQVMIHAIGPRANSIVLDAFERVAKQNGPRDRRFRVEHAYSLSEQDVPRFARKAIIPSMQPWLFHSSGPAIFSRHLALHSRIAFGSDAPMVDLDPLLGIYAAVCGPDGISVAQAVGAYTIGSAYAEFQERIKGTIEVGRLADMVVLSDNIFTIDQSRIPGVRVLLTMVDGKVVFQREGEFERTGI